MLADESQTQLRSNASPVQNQQSCSSPTWSEVWLRVLPGCLGVSAEELAAGAGVGAADGGACAGAASSAPGACRGICLRVHSSTKRPWQKQSLDRRLDVGEMLTCVSATNTRSVPWRSLC